MSTSLPAPSNLVYAPGAIVGGKYRIDGVLGTGGMGVVLSATHLELRAPVAIKVVRDELAQNEEVVARLLFEARAAAQMRSAHIVRILDVARLDSGAPYIVMEQLEGLDLAAVLAEGGPLPVVDAVNYLLQACEGLAEAHGLGIVHRDLKPENLFLANTPEGRVLKILDFGISKNLGTSLRPAPRSTLSRKGTTLGSPFYMSPEQMRASPNLDARADVWSLGAILFELLTCRCPFEANSAAALCSKVMVDDAPAAHEFTPDTPEELDLIIQRCLQKQPERRFQSARELASALRDFQRAAAAELSVPPEFETARPRRNASTLALAAISALLVFSAISFWRLQGRTEWARWSGTSPVPAETVKRSAPNSQAASRAGAFAEPRAVSVSLTAANPVPRAPSIAVSSVSSHPAVLAVAASHVSHDERRAAPAQDSAVLPQDGVAARYGL
ncbi:MAG: serine/threonine-protein kinase [Polyangiaceae bacterium]